MNTDTNVKAHIQTFIRREGEGENGNREMGKRGQRRRKRRRVTRTKGGEEGTRPRRNRVNLSFVILHKFSLQEFNVKRTLVGEKKAVAGGAKEGGKVSLPGGQKVSEERKRIKSLLCERKKN